MTRPAPEHRHCTRCGDYDLLAEIDAFGRVVCGWCAFQEFMLREASSDTPDRPACN